METEKLTLDNLLGADGFIPYRPQVVLEDQSTEQPHNADKVDKIDIFELLHKEGPIKKLKEFGMFTDREHINSKCLEYMNTYNIEKVNRRYRLPEHARYLLSRTFVFKKEIKDGTVVIDHNDFDFDRPLYHIMIKREDNSTIIETSYTVKMNYCENKHQLDVRLVNGFVDSGNQFIYNVWGKHKTKLYNGIIKTISPDTGHIFNTYTDSFDIMFDRAIENQYVIIECKVYDIYAYGGFFSCGWV